MERTPNLSAEWVGAPGPLHFHVVHRFWRVDAGEERKVVNSPTMLAAVPLPAATLAGVRYATNSLVASDRANEWEAFVRWAPFDPTTGRARLAVTAARNSAAGSWDQEISGSVGLASPAAGVRFLVSARRLGDAFGMGVPGYGVAGGAILRLSDGVAFAADLGTLWVDGEAERSVWGAGLQLRIPATPHTLSIHAANARTSTLQGTSSGSRTMWGFEFTVPFTPARYFPRSNPPVPNDPSPVTEPTDGRAGGPPPGDSPNPGPQSAEVRMTDDLRFVPDTVRVAVGGTVIWRNTGAMIHTVTADPERVRDPAGILLPPGAEPFDSGLIREGGSFRLTFTVPGTYIYECTPHELVGMRGVIIVTPSGPPEPRSRSE